MTAWPIELVTRDVGRLTVSLESSRPADEQGSYGNRCVSGFINLYQEPIIYILSLVAWPKLHGHIDPLNNSLYSIYSSTPS